MRCALVFAFVLVPAAVVRAQAGDLHTCVAATRGTVTDEHPPGRTLWHSIYLPEQRAVELDFYLGDVAGADGEGKVRRSEPRRFVLGGVSK